MRKFRPLHILLLASALAVGGAASTTAEARPGGGSSFRSGSSSSGGSRSGSSSSSSSSSSGWSSSSSSSSSGWSSSSSSGTYSGSSGSSSSGAGILIMLVLLVMVLVAIVILKTFFQKMGETAVSSFPAEDDEPVQADLAPRKQLRALFGHDPYFSLVVFDDFLVGIYTEIRTRVGDGTLERMSAYLTDHAPHQLLAASPGGPVSNVIVGAARITEARQMGAFAVVTVTFETNLQAGPNAFYLCEEWTLKRNISAKSRPPAKARSFDCPNCGAPQANVTGGRCSHCGQSVGNGLFDWAISSVTISSREMRGPMLTSDTPEQGNNESTIIDPELYSRLADLKQRDPAFQESALQQRVGLIFQEFQTAWAARDLTRMRPWFSDSFFGVQKYWVDEYLKQRLRNVTENARIYGMEFARVESDGYFDAITLRVFAGSLDYTLRDDTQQIVSGTRASERRYTEYWTLIRGRDVKGPAKVDKNCPKCGAPLALEMGGKCKYCNTHVTTGQFDWVLSRIEQDDVYEG